MQPKKQITMHYSLSATLYPWKLINYKNWNITDFTSYRMRLYCRSFHLDAVLGQISYTKAKTIPAFTILYCTKNITQIFGPHCNVFLIILWLANYFSSLSVVKFMLFMLFEMSCFIILLTTGKYKYLMMQWRHCVGIPMTSNTAHFQCMSCC